MESSTEDECCKFMKQLADIQSSGRHSLDFSSLLTGNKFYFPNMCNVCHCFGEEVAKLKRCGACGMISYCGEIHQKQDWSTHKPFCKVLCQIKKERNVNNLFESMKSIVEKIKNTCNDQAVNYEIIQENILAIQYPLKERAVQLLGRNLTNQEFQMIRFPRVCAICYESKQEILVNCKKCPQATFCKEHLNDPNHKSECLKIISCFKVMSNDDVTPPPSVIEPILKATYQEKAEKLPSTMLDVIEKYLAKNLEKFGDFNITVNLRSDHNVALSDRFSRPLTLLFSIDKLSLNNLQSMVIHVVGANQAEHLINDWELILHFLPQLRELQIILIGPSLLSNSKEIQKFCNLCRKGKRKLTIETKKTVYSGYCKGKNYLKPDIICLNTGFNPDSTWKESMLDFYKGQCPLLVTTKCKAEGLNDKYFIDSTFPMANCLYCDENPFTSLSYTRQNIFVPISANNQFIFIYDYLVKKKVSN